MLGCVMGDAHHGTREVCQGLDLDSKPGSRTPCHTLSSGEWRWDPGVNTVTTHPGELQTVNLQGSGIDFKPSSYIPFTGGDLERRVPDVDWDPGSSPD